MGAVLMPDFSQANNRHGVSYAKSFHEIFSYVRDYLTQNRRITLRGLYDLLPRQAQALYPPQTFIRQYSMFQGGDDIEGHMNHSVATAFLSVMEVKAEKLAPHWGMFEDSLTYIDLAELCELIRIHQKYSHRDLDWVYQQLPPEQAQEYPLAKLQAHLKFFLEHSTVSGRVPKKVAYPILRAYEQIKVHGAVTFSSPVLVVDNNLRADGSKPRTVSKPDTSIEVTSQGTHDPIQKITLQFGVVASDVQPKHAQEQTFHLMTQILGNDQSPDEVITSDPTSEPSDIAADGGTQSHVPDNSLEFDAVTPSISLDPLKYKTLHHMIKFIEQRKAVDFINIVPLLPERFQKEIRKYLKGGTGRESCSEEYVSAEFCDALLKLYEKFPDVDKPATREDLDIYADINRLPILFMPSSVAAAQLAEGMKQYGKSPKRLMASMEDTGFPQRSVQRLVSQQASGVGLVSRPLVATLLDKMGALVSHETKAVSQLHPDFINFSPLRSVLKAAFENVAISLEDTYAYVPESCRMALTYKDAEAWLSGSMDFIPKSHASILMSAAIAAFEHEPLRFVDDPNVYQTTRSDYPPMLRLVQ